MKKSTFLTGVGCASLLLAVTGCSTFSDSEDAGEYGLTDPEFCKACSLAYYTKGLLIENDSSYPTNTALEIAGACYETAWAFAPESKRPFDAAVSAAIRRKQYDEAYHLFDAYLQRHPEDVETHLEAACCADAAANLTNAISHLEQIVRLAPANRKILPLLIQAYYTDKRDADALKVLKANCTRYADNPSRALVYQWILHFIADKRESPRAIPLLRLAASDETNGVKRAAVLHQLAFSSLLAGQTNGVFEILYQAHIADRSNLSPLITLAQLYNGPASHAKAIDALLKNDSHHALFFVQAIARNQKGLPDEAYKLLERYRAANAQIEPVASVGYYTAAASILEASGRASDVIPILEEGLAAHPKSKELKNNFAYLLAQRGIRLEEAQKLINEALDADPDQAAYIDTKGWILFKMGRHHEALQYILKAAEKAKDEPEILDHLGDVLEAVGRHSDARAAWKKAAALEPNPAIDAKLKK